MTANADDRIDDQTQQDHAISVTSLGEAGQVPAGHVRDEQSHDDLYQAQPQQEGPYRDEQFRAEQFQAEEVTDDRGPLADDGQPIFPPEPGDSARFASGGATSDQESQLTDDAPGQHRGSDDGVVPEPSSDASFGQVQDAGFGQDQDAGFDRDRDATLAQQQATDSGLSQAQSIDTGTGTDTGYDQTTDAASAAPVETTASTPVATTPAPASEPAHKTTSDDEAWLTLQGKFVDDPAAAVQEAADRVEKQLADVRSGLSSADTEGLRTAFRRYRELSDSLR